MKEEIQERWAVALEDEETYEQGSGMLHNFGTNEFCCLGVLCDLYLKEMFMTWDLRELAGSLNPSVGYLPKEVQEWAGLNMDNVLLPMMDGTPDICATVANDANKYSFKTIAKMVRRIE